MILKDAVLKDRKERRAMSRRAYGLFVGITEGRVHALEHGRKLKDGELELLMPVCGDLLDPEITGATLNEEATPPEGPTKLEKEVEAERREIGNWYLAVVTQLQSRIPPVNWPSQFRMETVPPIEFQAIRDYLTAVSLWLQQQDGYSPPPPDQASTDAAPPTTTPPTDDVPEDEVENEDETEGEWETTYDTSQPTTSQDPIPPAPDLTQAASSDGTFVQDPQLTYVTNGELSTFLDCQRRWYLESYRALTPPDRRVTGAAAVGTRFHGALAVWYRPEPGDPWAWFNESVKDDQEYLEDLGADPDKMKEFQSEVDLTRAMIEGYFEWVSETSADVGMQIVAPEAIISANPQYPEFPNHRLLAKLDLRYVDERDGSRWFLDHKSVGNFSDLLKVAHMDPQMLHYHLIEWLRIAEEGLSQDIRAAGAQHNMARRLKRTAAAKPPFYQREPVRHNVEQLQSYWRRVRRTIEKIEEARSLLNAGAHHLDVVPPRPTKDCAWKCDFYLLCPLMDEDGARSEDMINERYVVVNPLRRYEPDAVGETM